MVSLRCRQEQEIRRSCDNGGRPLPGVALPIDLPCPLFHGSFGVAREPFVSVGHGLRNAATLSRRRKEFVEQRPLIELLRGLGARDLQKLWKEGGQSQPSPGPRCLLLREVAWRMQTQAQGGLDAETHRSLRVAIRTA